MKIEELKEIILKVNPSEIDLGDMSRNYNEIRNFTLHLKHFASFLDKRVIFEYDALFNWKISYNLDSMSKEELVKELEEANKTIARYKGEFSRTNESLVSKLEKNSETQNDE